MIKVLIFILISGSYPLIPDQVIEVKNHYVLDHIEYISRDSLYKKYNYEKMQMIEFKDSSIGILKKP